MIVFKCNNKNLSKILIIFYIAYNAKITKHSVLYTQILTVHSSAEVLDHDHRILSRQKLHDKYIKWLELSGC